MINIPEWFKEVRRDDVFVTYLCCCDNCHNNDIIHRTRSETTWRVPNIYRQIKASK